MPRTPDLKSYAFACACDNPCGGKRAIRGFCLNKDTSVSSLSNGEYRDIGAPRTSGSDPHIKSGALGDFCRLRGLWAPGALAFTVCASMNRFIYQET